MHHEITIRVLQIGSIPMEILKDIVVEISPILTALINCSLENGVFPDKLKEVVLRPLLKKINLDPIKMNYRPFSNLAFVGKLNKCIASNQIISHIDKRSLLQKNQFAHWEFHSTETTLIKVKSNILKVMDIQEVNMPGSSRFVSCFQHGGS